MNYSGVILSSSNQNDHIKNRISACRKAFYGFQGAGFSSGYIDSNVIVYVWNSAIRPVLTYGINCVHLSKSSLSDAEKIQSKLLKAALGIHKYCKSTPLLQAVRVMKILQTHEISSLDLMKSIFCNKSRARSFYLHLLNMHYRGKLKGHTDLISRCNRICVNNGILPLRYIFDKQYSCTMRKNMKTCSGSDGLTDSVRQLLLAKDVHSRCLLNMLLRPF